jgi:hypothetical protein
MVRPARYFTDPQIEEAIVAASLPLPKDARARLARLPRTP